jgi:hypothetical protein
MEENNEPSVVDPRIFIGNNLSAVTLVREGVGREQHAALLIERMENGRHTVLKAHLIGLSTVRSNNGSEANPRNGLYFEAQGTVETRDLTGRELRFQSATPTWNVPPAHLQIMLDQINAEIPGEGRVHRPVYFQILGSKSVINQASTALQGADYFNCISWALERLKFAGIVLHTDNLNFITTTASYTNPPENGSVTQFFKCVWAANKAVAGTVKNGATLFYGSDSIFERISKASRLQEEMERDYVRAIRPNIREAPGINELCLFAKYGNPAAIREYFPVGFDVDQLVTSATNGPLEQYLGKYTALVLSAGYGHLEATRVLVERYGANIERKGGRIFFADAIECALFCTPLDPRLDPYAGNGVMLYEEGIRERIRQDGPNLAQMAVPQLYAMYHVAKAFTEESFKDLFQFFLHAPKNPVEVQQIVDFLTGIRNQAQNNRQNNGNGENQAEGAENLNRIRPNL